MTRDEQEGDMAFLGTVSTEQNDAPWLIKLKVNGSEVLFKVDIGADVTVVSEELFKQENLEDTAGTRPRFTAGQG